MEKKLSSAIDELIDAVIELYPNLKKPLAKIQRVLRKMAASGPCPGVWQMGAVTPRPYSEPTAGKAGPCQTRTVTKEGSPGSRTST